MITLHTSLKYAAAVSVIAFGAQATTVSNVSIVDATQFETFVVSDTADNDRASVTVPFSDSVATQNADGTSEVRAATNSFGPEQQITSTATFVQNEVNTSNMDRDYTLTFDLTGQSADFNIGFPQVARQTALATRMPPLLPPVGPPVGPVTSDEDLATVDRTSGIAPSNPLNPFTEVNDPTVLTGSSSPVTAASFEYIIQVNGDTIFNARADALLENFDLDAGLQFDAVDGFVPTATGNSSDGFTFSVGAISGSFDLGTFAAGETINVTSSLIARAYTPGVAIDSEPITINTFSSDPVNLSNIGNLSFEPTDPSPIPLPAAGWLLVAAFGGLGLMKRRQTA